MVIIYSYGWDYDDVCVCQVVDMRFERQGNDVALFKGCLPISQYKGLGFINFVQSITFPCAELQSRYLLGVFKVRDDD